ncbi:MAG: hypothetical protein HY040_11235 [Planctomycetes bacterium]|nr:hypothetical protein [Planctomycetota bacterium]
MAKVIGLLSLAAALFCLSAAGVGADDEFKKKGRIDSDTFFKKLDANGDGKLSRDEFLKLADRVKDKDKDRVRDRLARTYDKLDPQRKGLTKEQFKTFLEMKKNGDKQSPPSSN